MLEHYRSQVTASRGAGLAVVDDDHDPRKT
jgi:hypothetical protein